MFQRFSVIKKEFEGFSSKEKFFILFAMACGFFISLEYSITRPASNAIFITNLSTKLFPFVWLCTVPINLVIIHFYHRFLSKWGCLPIFFTICGSVIVLNGLTGVLVTKVPSLIFIQFILKDIYILLMFKQMWSLIHVTISKERAKYFYGILFGMGGIGSICGSMLPGFSAVEIGSEKLFFFSIPIYLLLSCVYYLAFKYSSFQAKQEDTFIKTSSKDLFSSVRKSKYLVSILCLVVFMQTAIALTDYQFNFFLETQVATKDLRTQLCGRLIGITNIVTTCFQFFGGFMLIQWLGLKKNHLLVPSTLLVNAAVFFMFPSFSMISFSLVTIKSVDHSLFGISREMLYIPLKTDEKFRAKAVIDVFAWRTAKAVASLIIFTLQIFSTIFLIPFISIFLMIIFIAWQFIVLRLFRQKEAKIFTAVKKEPVAISHN